MIIVEPSSGLCSRIFVLCEAYQLAKEYHRKLVIFWLKTADCNCNYYDIFDETQFNDIDCKVIQFDRFGTELRDKESFRSVSNIIKFSKELCRRIWFGCTYYPIRAYYLSRCSVHKNAYRDGNRALVSETVKDTSCFIEAYNGITHTHDVSSVRFLEVNLDKAKKLLEITNGNCIGVHIRRTDHEPAKGSLTDNFIMKMKGLLDADSGLYFFLATDDWAEQEKIVKVFGEHIIIQKEKVLNRSSEQGMYSSMIDFLCLSQTNYILGSRYSMFSEFAARLGNIDLVII